jgi:sporulation protein YlmC with PRC-barrel domain
MKLTPFVAATALVLAASPLVLAQTQPQGDPSATKPPTATAPGEKMQPKWYTAQGSELRASKLIGTSVVNAANETVGDINDVILGKDGKVAAVVLGVGGFLGMGEREVAVEFSSLRLKQDGGKTVVTIDATKDALKNAPEWKWAGDRGGTTGRGTPPSK